MWYGFACQKIARNCWYIRTFRNGVFIELIADQGRLELGAEETVSITPAIQHHEVEGKYRQVDDDRPTDETQNTGKEMTSQSSLQQER